MAMTIAACGVSHAPDTECLPPLQVSAAFSGLSNGRIVMAGGCNFPIAPLAADSRKVYYDDIYEVLADTVIPIGHLPMPLAYGFSATTPEGIVMGGGTGNSRVWRVSLSADSATIDTLPQLPCVIDNASACAIGNTVYVAGGNHDGTPANTLLRLDSTGWHAMPPFPGNPRTQPVVAAGRNADGEQCVWLFGGFAGSGQAATLDCDGYVFVPSSGVWQHVDGPVDEEGEPLSTAGGAACTLADGSIMVTGGVNKDIFLSALRQQPDDYLQHPAEWYRFNHRVLVFAPGTRQWRIVWHDTATARAGASLVPLPDNTALLMGGELKPRIRTALRTIVASRRQ